jgi:hypothetical protein
MKVKRPRRKKMGITTVVSNVLMIAMVTAMFAIALLWSTGHLSALTSSWTTQTDRSREVIVIEEGSYDTANNKIILYVRNVGLITVKINTAYVNNAQVTPTYYTPTGAPRGAELVPRDMLMIKITPPGPGPYTVTVITERGITDQIVIR